MWVPLFVGVLLILGVVVHHFEGRNDSEPEQLIEELIKVESGINVDFSAADKEAAKKNEHSQ